MVSATRSIDWNFCLQVTTNAIVHKVQFVVRFDIDSGQWEDNKDALMSELQRKFNSRNVKLKPLFR